MREVVRPHQALNIDHMLHLEGNPVILERQIDMVVKAFAWHFLQFLALHPEPVPLVGVVGAVHEVRRPARIGLNADNFQVRIAVKHA